MFPVFLSLWFIIVPQQTTDAPKPVPTVTPTNQTALPVSAPETQVVINKKSVILKHKKRRDNEYDSDKTATVRFPVIAGLSDETILKKVQSNVSLKGVFGESLEELRREFQESWWLDGTDYRIDYNKNFILDVTFWMDGTGAYPSTTFEHRIINLKTGELLKASDVFKATSLKTLQTMCQRALRNEIRKAQKEHGADVEGLFSHNQFPIKSLNDFSVSEKGVTFLHEYDFPHVAKALEPAGRFFFTFEALKPYIKSEGLLGVFVTNKKD